MTKPLDEFTHEELLSMALDYYTANKDTYPNEGVYGLTLGDMEERLADEGITDLDVDQISDAIEEAEDLYDNGVHWIGG